jgi:hypothetical protein
MMAFGVIDVSLKPEVDRSPPPHRIHGRHRTTANDEVTKVDGSQ